MLFGTLNTLEIPIIKTMQNLDGTTLDPFFEYVSNISLMLVSFALVIAILIWKKHKLWKPLLFALIVSLIIDVVINEGFFKTLLVQFGIFRPRPWTLHTDILAIGHAFQDSSFPSSHMAFTVLLVMIISYFEKRFLYYGLIIILVMGVSRIHNGMHYPTDVLMGILMGIIYGYIGLSLMKKSGLEKQHWWEKLFR